MAARDSTGCAETAAHTRASSASSENKSAHKGSVAWCRGAGTSDATVTNEVMHESEKPV